MDDDAVVNIAALIAALPGDNPVGVNLRADYGSSFYALKDDVTEARRVEAQRTSLPDWTGIVASATKLLTSQSKDIDVLAWMIEGLLRTDRFKGLRDGMLAARQVIETFWDTMYPPPDREEPEQRLKIFVSMAGNGGASLLPALRLTPLVEGTLSVAPGSADRPVPVSLFAHGQASATGGASFEAVRAMARSAGIKYLDARYREVQECRAELIALENVFSQKCAQLGVASVYWTSIARLLEEITDTYTALSEGKIVIAEPVIPIDATDVTKQDEVSKESPTSTVTVVGTHGQLTREKAFEQIRQIARYFEQSEPQSIIGPALLRVVEWGEMPLGELLKAFVPESDHRRMFTWLGIQPKPNSESSDG